MSLPNPVLHCRSLGYRYPSGSEPALGPLDLDLRAGEVTLLAGPTGSGKSTLLRLAAGLLRRHGHGHVEGSVEVLGHDPAALDPSHRAARVAFASQEASDQIVTDDIRDEIAFSLRLAGWGEPRVRARVDALIRAFELPPEPARSPRRLSGGQQQRLVVAASLALGARLLLLDEPLAQLDPRGARELLATLRATAEEGIAVLLVEHRLEACWPFCDRVLLLDRGRLVVDDAPDAISSKLLERLGLSAPADGLDASRAGGDPDAAPPPSPCLELSGVAHRYPDGTGSLHDIDLTLSPGERLALVGANGSGKSTLLGLLARELRPTLGRLIASESRSTRPLLIPQNPDLSLFCESVEEEIAYGPREARLPLEAVRARVAHAATALSVEKLLGRRPQALSRGQRLRVAVAAALACEPSILLLDEPTAGQDRLRVATLMRALLPAMAGRSLVFATHDLDLALRFATRLAVLDAGRLLSVAGPAATRALLASGRLPSLAPPALPRRAPP